VRTVALVTALSRPFGLVRALVLVRVFGDTPVGSAFNFAFALPNLFRRLFGEGALSAAFIPEYAAAAKSDPALAARLASLTVALLALATGALTILCELIVAAVLMVAPGDAEAALSYRLVMVMLPFMPLVCIAATLGGMLQVHNRFGPPAATPIILNLGMIAGAVPHFLTGGEGPTDAARAAYVIGGATVAAGVVQLAWCLFFLRRDVRWTRAFHGAGAATKRMFRRYIPVMLGLGTLQLGTLLDAVITMYPIWVGATVLGFMYPLDKSSNAILAPTQQLYQFPLGVFGIAVAAAVFPMLSRHSSEPEAFIRMLRRALRLSLFIGLPASIGLMLVREDLVAVLFGGGRRGFSEGGVDRSAAVLLGYAPAIWAYSLNHVLTRAFYARHDTKTPTKVAVSMVAMNLALNCILIWFLRESGLAWGTSITATVQFVILWRLLRRRLSVGAPGITDGVTRAALAKIVGASAGMGAAVAAALWLAPDAGGTWSTSVLRLGIGCAAGLLSYGALSLAIGSEELRWLVQRKRQI
jgi:putative peptidoglycan lipid II flippase